MIVVAGEHLIDFTPTGGRGASGALYEACPGGGPFNCAIALARLGGTAGYLCPLSGDAFGVTMRAMLEADGARVLIEAPTAALTALAIVGAGPDGKPVYAFHRAGTSDRVTDPAPLIAALPERPAAFHIGTLALASAPDADYWLDVAEAAAARGAVVSIDPNVRPGFIDDWAAYLSRLARAFDLASIVKASDDDLLLLDPDSDPRDTAQALSDRHDVPLILLTRGADGAETLGATRASAPAMPIRPGGDTVGAGDSFAAASLAWLAEADALSPQGLRALGADQLGAMLRFAVTVAGLNCQSLGANPPHRATVKAAMA